MANKTPDLHMISRIETQCKGNLAGAKLLQNIPSAICPTRTRSVFSCSRAVPPPSGDLQLRHKHTALPLFPQTHF